jgi:hypothetical protein
MDGLQCIDGVATRGFNDATVVGIETGAPLGAEAVGDLAEYEPGSKCPFGIVVGRRAERESRQPSRLHLMPTKVVVIGIAIKSVRATFGRNIRVHNLYGSEGFPE